MLIQKSSFKDKLSKSDLGKIFGKESEVDSDDLLESFLNREIDGALIGEMLIQATEGKGLPSVEECNAFMLAYDVTCLSDIVEFAHADYCPARIRRLAKNLDRVIVDREDSGILAQEFAELMEEICILQDSLMVKLVKKLVKTLTKSA